MSKRLFADFLLVVLVITPAMAYDFENVAGHVTLIEGDLMPATIVFQLDVNAGSCTAGVYSLAYYPQNADQAKSVYALLLSAYLSGAAIRVYGYNNGCQVTLIYLTN